jgi:GTPase SAR1 family protein
VAEPENVYLYLVGTAGSGKTRLTAALRRWCVEHHLDAVAVNLDPGAEELPYEPDVDIRDWLRLADIMAEHGLGPNGAQVVAADLLALNAQELLDAIEGFRSDYVLLDTPGQTELFVFREAGKHIVERFAPERSALAFLVDPFLARRPAAFVSQMMLAATAQFRFQVPMVSVLSKADALPEEDRERILSWMEDPGLLHEALDLGQEGMHGVLNAGVLRVLEELGATTQLVPASAETLDGLDDLYGFLQNAFAAAEDATTR